MQFFSASLGSILIALLLQGCTSMESQGSAGRDAPSPPSKLKRYNPPLTASTKQELVTVERLQQIQRTYPLWREAVSTAGYQCPAGPTCVVIIQVYQGTDVNSGDDYCIGVAPKFILVRKQDKVKLIVWQLQLIDPASGSPLLWSTLPSGTSLDFLGDGDRGILITQNIDDGHGNPALKDGRRGPAPGDTSDTRMFNVRHMHDVMGTAIYLPVIVYSVGGYVDSLCGTPDPTIYNVN
jgi:hypothetical protein